MDTKDTKMPAIPSVAPSTNLASAAVATELATVPDTSPIPLINPKDIRWGSVIAMIGARKSGKVSSLYNTVLLGGQYKRVAVLSSFEKDDAYTFGSFVPPSCIFPASNRKKIQEILKFQGGLATCVSKQMNQEFKSLKDGWKEGTKTREQQTVKDLLSRTSVENWSMQTLIEKQAESKAQLEAQDAEATKQMALGCEAKEEIETQKIASCLILPHACELRHNKEMPNLIYNGRHYRITLCLMFQRALDAYFMMPDCSLSSNADWIVMFRNYNLPSDEDRHRWKHFGRVFPTLKAFQDAMEIAKMRDCALAIRRNHANPTLENSVFLWPRQCMPLKPKMLGREKLFDNDPLYYSESTHSEV